MNLEQIPKCECDEVIENFQPNQDEFVISNREDYQSNQLEIPMSTIEADQISKQNSKKFSYENLKLMIPVKENGNGFVRSVRVFCPTCKQNIDTVLTKKTGFQTWIAAFLLLFCSFGLICIACIPWFIDDCKDVYHRCPNCKRELGRTNFKIID